MGTPLKLLNSQSDKMFSLPRWKLQEPSPTKRRSTCFPSYPYGPCKQETRWWKSKESTRSRRGCQTSCPKKEINFFCGKKKKKKKKKNSFGGKKKKKKKKKS